MISRFSFLMFIVFCSLNAQQTYVPDDNFEQALIDLGYDNVLDDYVLTNNIESITDLNLYNKSISDLTGIQDFLSLTRLDLTENLLQYIDLSINVNLDRLYIDRNQLTNLNLNNNVNLSRLNVSRNQLTNLDLSSNHNLQSLDCEQNNLTELDLTNNLNITSLNLRSNNLLFLDLGNNVNLDWFDVSQNQLTNLNLSNNHNIRTLFCYQNDLVELDISNLFDLAALYCSGNQLESLNLKNGNNGELYILHAETNPNLFCIDVDDAEYSETYWRDFVDPWASFSEDCENMGIMSQEKNNISIYPNPVENTLTVENQDLTINKINLIDVNGKTVFTKSLNTNPIKLNLKSYQKGIYFLQLLSGEKIIQTEKILRNSCINFIVKNQILNNSN